jgi:RimJ/RimL family protein N-acetyltransferase
VASVVGVTPPSVPPEGAAPRPTVPCAVPAGPLRLRPWDPDRAADRAAVLAYARDPEGRTWNPLSGLPDHPTDADARAWCARQADWASATGCSWAVTAAGDDANVLGYVSVHQWDEDQRMAQVGYWVVPSARRGGVGSRALAALAGWCLAERGLHRLELFHAVENAASCATAEAAGFRGEGVHRLSHRFGDGKYHDEHTHARLASDPPTALEIADPLPYAVRALDG